MTRIPYGTSNFESLLSQDYYYIDRTSFIETLEGLGEKYIVFLRPRRFGKSLWISTLEYYYGLEHKQNFSQLFAPTYIGQRPTDTANSYMILKWDFSGILTNTLENTWKGFLSNVKIGISRCIARYSSFFSEEIKQSILSAPEAAEMVKQLFSYLEERPNLPKIYVLIDEYDHFANELISFHFDDYQDIVSRNGYVRKFYEAIKVGTGAGIVDRIFITGVSPITLDSFTSGFNIAKNLSTHQALNAMMGFTYSEVSQLIEDIGASSDQLPEVMHDLKQWYNGYLFHPRGEERLYNPNMVLYFASEYIHQQRYPDRILDTNVATDYGKLHQIFKIGHQDEQHYDIIEELIENQEIAARLTAQYSFERSFTRDDFVSLLFYLGLITIKEEQLMRTVFQVPNYVIGELYYQYFADILLRRSQLTRDKIKLDDAVEDLALNNHMQPFVEVVERVLTTLSNRDSVGFDEKHVKAIITSLLYTTGIYTIKSEYETEKKYVDLLLAERPPIRPNFTFALELKYLKLSEAAQLEKVREQARSQLTGYLQHEELQQMRNLKSWILIFVGTEAKAVMEVETT